MISPGDTVTFQQRYGPGRLQAKGDYYTIAYRRRRVRGTVKQIIDTFVFIQVEGAPQYSGLVGVPMSKVKLLTR